MDRVRGAVETGISRSWFTSNQLIYHHVLLAIGNWNYWTAGEKARRVRDILLSADEKANGHLERN